MMGREDPPQPSLFYTSFSLDKRVRSNHPLRKVSKVIDFGFVSDDERNHWGQYPPFTLFSTRIPEI